MAFLSGFKMPEDDAKYAWTRHVKGKMLFYSMPASLIKRVIRYPERMEKGIAEGTVAAMKKAGAKKAQEYWVMYVPGTKKKKQIRVITEWRCPGVSPVREAVPIPDDILRELEDAGEL